MTLRAKKPETIEKRFKALFYGAAGSGKTTAAIQFPYSYLIDTEHGAEHQQYVDLLSKNEGVIFQSSDFEDVLKEVRSLLTEEHPYKTLIIDPMTTIYENLIDLSTKEIVSKSREKGVDGTEYGRHIALAGKKMKRLMDLLLRLDMNIIITSHSKNEYIAGKSTDQQTFDCYKKLDYIFDLVIEIQKRDRKRIGIVKKSRIKSFEELETFEFSYETVSEKYGKEIIEKEAVKEILATKEQLEDFYHLIKILKIEQEVIDKWLEKAKASSADEMETSKIQKCIDHLQSKIEEK